MSSKTKKLLIVGAVAAVGYYLYSKSASASAYDYSAYVNSGGQRRVIHTLPTVSKQYIPTGRR